MKYKGIIFDLDGVLCSTDRYHYLAWKTVADRLGVYFDETINNRLRGVSRMASLEIILERAEKSYTPEEKEAFAAEKNEYYRQLLGTMSPADLSNEVRDTLPALRARGYLLAIGSSSKNTKLILRRIGLADFFDAIADGTEISRSKPDPEVFLTAARKLGAAPEQCAVVEDAQAGILAAKSGGMIALALGGDAAGCGLEDGDLSRFSDLLTLLEKAVPQRRGSARERTKPRKPSQGFRGCVLSVHLDEKVFDLLINVRQKVGESSCIALSYMKETT